VGSNKSSNFKVNTLMGDQLSDFIAVNHVRHGIVDWDKKNLPSIMHSIRTAVAAKIL
jgi:hypothetical protein